MQINIPLSMLIVKGIYNFKIAKDDKSKLRKYLV